MTDTLLHRVPEAEMTPQLQASRDAALRLSGDATIIEVFANSKAASTLLFEDFYQKVFFGGEVDRRYKELLRLRLSKLHGCFFCNRNNEAGALEVGFTPAQIDAIGGDAVAEFTPAETAVLALADELALTNMGGRLDAELYAQLKACFTDGQIMELGTVGGVLGGMNKLSFVFDLVEREPYCPFHKAA